MSVNKTLRLFLVVIFSTVSATRLLAADSVSDAAKHGKLADMAREYLTGTSQSNLSFNTDDGTDGEFPRREVSPDSANYLGSTKWSATFNGIYKDGAWIVQFYDRLIAIKPGFVRGSSLGGAYTTDPVALITDITGSDYGEVFNYSVKFPGNKSCFGTPSGSFHFAFTTNKLVISKCVNGQPNSDFTKETTYKEWINIWAQDAAKYCGTDIANYCFIPQKMRTDEYYGDIARITYRFGYVASKGVPMGGAGGQPADFLELFKWNQQDDWVSAQNKYSPPLKLAFNFVPQGSQAVWDVYELTKEELKAAEESWKAEEPPATLPENTLMQPTPELPSR